ncbi:hypothetical protein TRVL_05799 [Trypanosoma vivax]|nr:hypothetical protein TRVL_05799 [Trypanosoma vivax]
MKNRVYVVGDGQMDILKRTVSSNEGAKEVECNGTGETGLRSSGKFAEGAWQCGERGTNLARAVGAVWGLWTVIRQSREGKKCVGLRNVGCVKLMADFSLLMKVKLFKVDSVGALGKDRVAREGGRIV